jgi:hypothetical protein
METTKLSDRKGNGFIAILNAANIRWQSDYLPR